MRINERSQRPRLYLEPTGKFNFSTIDPVLLNTPDSKVELLIKNWSDTIQSYRQTPFRATYKKNSFYDCSTKEEILKEYFMV